MMREPVRSLSKELVASISMYLSFVRAITPRWTTFLCLKYVSVISVVPHKMDEMKKKCLYTLLGLLEKQNIINRRNQLLVLLK